MDTDRWRRISRLYYEALERPDAERNAFLDDCCQDDPVLRREVASLLADGTGAESWLGLQPGLKLGTYRIERPLGRGGMGVVFLAYDTILHRHVALKVLASKADAGTARERLLREARNAAALSHPNICTVHEIGESDGRAFIAMEYVEGCSLSERLDKSVLPVDEAVRYGIEAADALAYAHGHGVVHRDLKAANAIVTTNGRLKLVDFGLARREDALLASATTMPSLVHDRVAVGTPYAMAPEQVRGGVTDPRTDIWALGVLLYEMVSGAKPFSASTIPELFSSILRDVPVPLATSVPPDLRLTIERCIEKDPDRRYQKAGEVREALEAIHSGRTAPFSSLRYRFVRRPVLATGAVVIAGVAVLGGLNVERIRPLLLGGAARLESLAVLPLENLSGDAAQDYFADGMTEVLSTDLARLGALKRVTARGSVTRYKGTSRPLAEIARELNVDALVTGSVLRSGNRISVTAQLLDPATGDQLWSNRYDRDLQDVLVLRNEIVSSIVREIRAELSPAEAARLASRQQVNPEAFEADLKGRFYRLKQTREDFDVAERYFQLALDKDPGYALGYAGLSTIWLMRGDAGFQPPSETFPKASMYMATALKIDPELDDLHLQFANHKVAVEWDWRGAEEEFRRALELNPNLAEAHFFYADLLVALKRTQEWNREVQRALELDPLNEFQRTYYGWHLNYLRRYDEAIPIFQKLLPTGPNKAANHLGLWGAYYHKRMFREAAAAAREYFVSAGDGEFADSLGAGADEAQYRAGMERTADAMVAAAGRRHVPALRIARMFVHAGDRQPALDWLEQAHKNHESPLSRLAVVWDWQELHGEPRFQELLRRMNLPQ
jgi:serine/threonine-protein kinase